MFVSSNVILLSKVVTRAIDSLCLFSASRFSQKGIDNCFNFSIFHVETNDVVYPPVQGCHEENRFSMGIDNYFDLF